MSVTSSPTQSELYPGLLPVEPSAEPPPVSPITLENERPQSEQPSLRKRASRAVSRFLIAFCIGVAATLAWQSHGDVAREMIANSYPQLAWLAPQPEPNPHETVELVAPAAFLCSFLISQRGNVRAEHTAISPDGEAGAEGAHEIPKWSR